MKEIVAEILNKGALPEGWYTDSLCSEFLQDGMHSGHRTELQIVLPDSCYKKLVVEIVIDAEDGVQIYCDRDHNTRIDLQLKSKYARHSAFRREHEIAHSTLPTNFSTKISTVVFEFDYGSLRALVNGVEIISAVDDFPLRASKRLLLGFTNNCVVHSIKVFGDTKISTPVCDFPQNAEEDFFLEVCVDFFDDLIQAPYKKETFDALFAELKSWGTRRVQWIYYGKMQEGWWDYCTWGVPANAHATYKNVGDIFTAAVEAAHRHGIEIYGLIKPFDMGLRYTFGENTPEAAKYGRVKMVGGSVGWVTKFIAENRDLMTSRKPGVYGDAVNDIFTRIDLVKEDDLPCAFSVEDLKLYVSDDNIKYSPYQGNILRSEIIEDYPLYEHTTAGVTKTAKTAESRVFRLDNLDIRAKYIALAVDSREQSFGNNPANLLHIYGERGEETRFTFGHMLRMNEKGEELPFTEHGVEFDSDLLTTAVCSGGYDAMKEYYSLDSYHGFIAVGRGKDRYPLAFASPSYTQVRSHWLSWAKEVLDAGADGVEMRVRNHHSIWGYQEYGFEEPIVEEYKRRFGVDISVTDDFDKAAWRKLRGEAYTQFYQDLRVLVDSYGKKLGIHVSPTLDTDPECGAAMEVHWDWQNWLENNLADSVTMKEVWPGTRLAEKIFSYTKSQRIPAVFCPYANQFWKSPPYVSPPGGEKVIEAMIKTAKEGGCSGYQFYECAAVVHATPDGKIDMPEPALREVFQKYFTKE